MKNNGERTYEMLWLHLKVIGGSWIFTILIILSIALVAQSLEPFKLGLPILALGHFIGMGVFEIYCRWIQNDHTIYRLYGQAASVREFGEWSSPKGRDYYTEPDRRMGTSRRDQEYVQNLAHGGRGLESHKSGNDPDKVGAVVRRSRTWRPMDGRKELLASLRRGVRVGPDGPVRHYRPLLGVSGMAFGTLTGEAVSAISIGAARAGVVVNTGEGGLAEYHLVGGSDSQIEFQFGTGYFGCRDEDGNFDQDALVALAQRHPEIVSIQIKGSQGAKAGHSGNLPAEKVTEEVAAARGIPVGQDCKGSGVHTAFVGERGLVAFIAQLRKATGKPITVKMAIGSVSEFKSLCEAIRDYPEGAPDAIQVDGGEGGTGASYTEVFGQAALPLNDAIQIADLLLRYYDLRDRVVLIGSGCVFKADQIARVMALGADAVMTARGAKYALGCVAAGLCHMAGHCPSGVANNGEALNVELRAKYLENYYNALYERLAMFLDPTGIMDHRELVGSRTRYMDITDVHIWSTSDIRTRIELEEGDPLEALLTA